MSRLDRFVHLSHDAADLLDADARETGLDDTLANTFPASDPLSSLPNPDRESDTAVTTAPARTALARTRD